ncbi:hypothetical protein AGLY_014265 [Aphis glycines]|uniref:Uncharacterized protein n=1 Tax=Aphis glycines TaxID=307491 RepID=A0A6G0T4L7_APHGL|nr:hypothetical protein AGLY_014265 [Aphis glycines]
MSLQAFNGCKKIIFYDKNILSPNHQQFTETSHTVQKYCCVVLGEQMLVYGISNRSVQKKIAMQVLKTSRHQSTSERNHLVNSQFVRSPRIKNKYRTSSSQENLNSFMVLYTESDVLEHKLFVIKCLKVLSVCFDRLLEICKHFKVLVIRILGATAPAPKMSKKNVLSCTGLIIIHNRKLTIQKNLKILHWTKNFVWESVIGLSGKCCIPLALRLSVDVIETLLEFLFINAYNSFCDSAITRIILGVGMNILLGFLTGVSIKLSS